MDLIPCQVRGVFVAVSPAGVAPAVLLDVAGDICLPIYTGLWEAISINSAMNNEISPRPLTHDLFIEFLNRYQVTLRALHIDSLEEGVYYANLVLSRDNQEEMIDCRPSDGIAIAIRCKSGIFLERAVAESSGLNPAELPPFIRLQAYLAG
ncbi:MAG: bifunctional nuclease family protein [Methanomicrobiales archaeon]|nr:bifunctional nuclease family protein [Methanomicrobiales archaeon]